MASAQFTGDSITTTFPLPVFPALVTAVTVAGAGRPFKWSGKDITLTDAPDEGAEVIVTYTSKLEMLRALCGQDDVSDELLETYLTLAGNAVVRKRFPFLVDSASVPVPDQFAVLQCEIANEIFQKRGAEGENAHSENGVNRSYETAGISSSLLDRIIPCAKVPGV